MRASAGNSAIQSDKIKSDHLIQFNTIFIVFTNNSNTKRKGMPTQDLAQQRKKVAKAKANGTAFSLPLIADLLT